ncbi:hypothetical protein D4S03_09240 [bacterium]|nr:MAG: hypothetical protein D4S03_09240 [bacterium]
MGKAEKEPPEIEATLERIEAKIDRLLFLLGEGRGRTTAELGREADDIIERLKEKQARKEARKREAERLKKKE